MILQSEKKEVQEGKKNSSAKLRRKKRFYT